MLNQRIKNETIEAGHQFEIIFGASPDGAVISRLEDGIIAEINRGFTALTGYYRAELAGRNILEVPLWKDPADLKKVTDELRQKEVCNNYEALLLRKDGTFLTGLISARIVGFKGEEYILYLIRDISARKQDEALILARNAELAEAKRSLEKTMEDSERSRLALLSILEDIKASDEMLHNSEKYYRVLVESQRDLITRWRPDTTLTYVNQTYCDLVGHKREDLLGLPWLTLTPEESRDNFREFYLKLEKNPKVNEYQHFIKAADGTERWIAWNEVPILDDSGHLLEYQSVGRDITRMKLVEQDLIEKEQKLNKSQEIGMLGSWTWDNKNRKLEWSDELYKIWGLPESFDLKYDAIETMIHQDDRENNSKIWKQLMQKGGAANNEFRIIKPNGEMRHVYQNIEVVCQSNSGTLKAFGIMQDITQRKEAENIQRSLYLISNAALGCRDLQQLYIQVHVIINKLLSADNFYISLYDRTNGMLTFPYYKDEKNDYTQPRKFGQGLTEYIITTQRPLLVDKRVHDNLKREGKAQVMGYPSKHWLGVPLIAENQAFGALVVQSYDETVKYKERDMELLNFVADHVATAIVTIKNRQEIEENEKRYKTFLDSTEDMVYLKDENFRYLLSNKSVVKFLGKSPSELMERSDYDIMPPDLAAPFRKSDIEVLERNELLVSHVSFNGRYYESRKFPVKLATGKTGVGGYIRDITDLMRAEQSKKMVEQELEQSRKMEAIGQLAGGVAHDFNNMLTGIMGNAEMLQIKLSGNKEVEGPIENIIKSAEHSANLTKQLLAFARKGQYQLIPVNVHKIINETAHLLSSTLDRKIAIEQMLRANPSNILADPTQLENCLMNLGINARDAMPHGGRLLFSTDLIELDQEYINLHQYKIKAGPYVQITVSDTGTGMSNEVKKHLFEPFFTTKEPGKGTGLGLAGVYGCIKNHGGSIEVYSEIGHGTALKLYLPLLPRVQESALSEELTPPEQPGTGTILIVDDEEIIRNIATQLLESAGYRVIGCRDGVEAVKAYRNDTEGIDLVILDMIMPNKNGRETFYELQAINPKVRVLMSSGFTEDGETQEVIDSGARGFIQKPYRSTELLTKVHRAITEPKPDKGQKL
jgi:PAS domain S-box-containing protein